MNLQYRTNNENNISTYKLEKKTADLPYNIISNSNTPNTSSCIVNCTAEDTCDQSQSISKKLRIGKKSKDNTITDNKSACFWSLVILTTTSVYPHR